MPEALASAVLQEGFHCLTAGQASSPETFQEPHVLSKLLIHWHCWHISPRTQDPSNLLPEVLSPDLAPKVFDVNAYPSQVANPRSSPRMLAIVQPRRRHAKST